ncbi:MAG TPA: hypothetical protein VMV77_11865 [Bacteroidales bacterium]|nr:hypothetical protein [Bacteroidales bacterium]
MKKQNKNKNGKIRNQSGNDSLEDSYYDHNLSAEDSALFDTFGQYMKGRFDLDEVRNDPFLPEIEKDVKAMISDYHDNRTRSTVDEKFIKEICEGLVHDEKIVEEIKKIKLEINEKSINELTAEWVKDWHEKRQKNSVTDSNATKIKDYITSSLDSEVSEPEVSLIRIEPESTSRSLIIRYISFSAAAVIGAFILIKTLLPSSDPGKLYNSYYEPFNVISAVTRDAGSTMPDSYSSALENYKEGAYQAAATGFSNVVLSDAEVIPSRFFMGITEMALENYDEAINLLGSVANGSGEYRKEAVWYLGLSYIIAGEKAKAAGCFDQLAQSPGFYNERAEKILRRLK